MAWPTPAQVVSAAALELGLVGADIANPFASTDKNVLQMNALLQKLGQDLARAHPWGQLQTQGSITTIASVPSYALPSGFLRFIDQTSWNRTNQLPMTLTGPQGWQQLKARTAGGLINKVMRVFGGAIHLYETPTAAESIYFEFQSRFWVRDAIVAWANNTIYTDTLVRLSTNLAVYECTQGGTSAVSPADGPSGYGAGIVDGTCEWAFLYPSSEAAPGTDETTDTASDYLLFDYRLLVDGLKLYFRRAKGLDTSAEQQAYDASLAAALGGDGVAPVLSLNAPRSALIGPGNAPEGGYG